MKSWRQRLGSQQTRQCEAAKRQAADAQELSSDHAVAQTGTAASKVEHELDPSSALRQQGVFYIAARSFTKRNSVLLG
jgi:hypothetical protein